MSKKVAKTASKNNPLARKQASAHYYNEKKIKPVKVVINSRSFFSAEYDDSGELVLGKDGNPMPWSQVRYLK